MNFSILKVTLNNFKSYRGEHVLVFPTQPGLYFMTGENAREPELGSNGAGKSTILDAIYWCLYGKTLRGLRGADDIINDKEKSASVHIEINVGDEHFVIARKQNPNSLTLNGETVEQSALVNAIRLNPDAFIHSIIYPQFHKPFFELTPTEKLNLFSQIMNLDSWLVLSKRASDEVNSLDIQISRLDMRIESEEATLSDLEKELNTLEERDNSFKEDKKQAIAGVRNKIKNLNAFLKQSLTVKSVLSKEIIKVSSPLEQKADEISRLNYKKAQYDTSRLELIDTMHSNDARIKLLKTSIDKLNGLDSECPVCLQVVDKDHIKVEASKLRDELNTLIKNRTDCENSLNQIKKFVTKIDGNIFEIEVSKRKIDSEINSLKDKLSNTNIEIEVTTNKIADADVALKNEEKRQNPYTKLLDDKADQIEKALDLIDRSKKELLKLEARHEAVNYWVSGFKRVRLFLIEETIKSFEIEVNGCLSSLGLHNWEVNFDVERENKSGGITKGFTVLIKSKDDRHQGKFESWSGGEGQRLLIAGDMALSNLILQQVGLQNQIEFYDEPTTHLSEQGRHGLAETLHQRALSQGKMIILIDHTLINFGDYAGIIHIQKGDSGSKINSL